VTDTQTGKQLVVDNNYIMSPNDLCTIEFIDRMVDAGITTFKLEGRARAPEYVDAVVGAYRKAIDSVEDGTFTPELVESLMPSLHKVYNRGFSSGFYFGREGGWSGAPGSKATHRKVLVGPVRNYFAKAGVVVVQITDSKVSKGDDFLLVGPTTGVVKGTLDNLRIDGEPTDVANQGSLVSFQVPDRIRLSDRMFIMVPVANA
jgi:putative protease